MDYVNRDCVNLSAKIILDLGKAIPVMKDSVILPTEDYLVLLTDYYMVRDMEEKGIDIYGLLNDEQQDS